MKILGIESSCDETAAAVVEDGRRILSNVVVSQIDIHKAFGGVVPEVAARSHIEAILPVVDEAVKSCHHGLVSGSTQLDIWDEIDAIAVANTPGLMGSLLIGTLTARTLALLKNKPLYAVNHVQAHVYANFLTDSEDLSHSFSDELIVSKSNRGEHQKMSVNYFPLLALIVSGGHTQIVLFRDHGDFEIVGTTRDDAVGEAFDKVAKILGLPYPGGPSISEAAKKGDPDKYHLPKPVLKPLPLRVQQSNPEISSGTSSGRPSVDFSFSGLKTALLRAVQTDCGKDYTFPSNSLKTLLTASQVNDFSASFQKTACEILTDKLLLAYEEYQPKSVVIAGGVAANQELRRQISERLPIEASFPAPKYCTDNAAMVASLGYFTSLKNSPINPHDLDVVPTS